MKLLYDIANNRWFNENGDSFDSDSPTIPYGNTERVSIQLYSEVKNINSGSASVASWTKYNGFVGGGYGAILATDNNFLHWFKATLQTAVSAGELPVSTFIDIATSASVDDIAESGNIYLYDGNGGNEAVAYASREAISGGIRFTPAEGNVLANSYAVGAQSDIPEMLYAEAPMNNTISNPATGYFVFDFVCDSVKLRNKMQYNSVERVDDCKGLELTIFRTDASNIVTICRRFLLPSFGITGGIADIKSGVSVPVPERNQIIALLRSVIAQGLEVQGSADNEIWIDYTEIEDFQALRWFRFRLNGSGSGWSDAIPLIVGATGPQGEQGPAGEAGPQGETGAQGEQGPKGDSYYCYIAYASDTNGTDFSMTWSETLKYIAIKVSSTVIVQPTAADFTGLWTRFGGVDLQPYWNSTTAASGTVKYWSGTRQQYEQIASPNSETLYFLTDEKSIYLGGELYVRSFSRLQYLTSPAVEPYNDASFVYAVSPGDAITIDRTNLSSGIVTTFELWLVNSSGGTFSLPNDLVWIEGSAPDMSTAATMYVLVIRWDGTQLLANLAYSVDSTDYPSSSSSSSSSEEPSSSEAPSSSSSEEPSSSSSSTEPSSSSSEEPPSSSSSSGGTSAYVAYGAGSTSIHGLYKEAGTYNSKPYYDYAFSYNGGTGHYYMYFDLGYGWVIATALPGGSETVVLMYHSDKPLAPTPDATTWLNVFGQGTAPAPTVAKVQDYTTTNTPGTASFVGTYTYDAEASGNGYIIWANGAGCHMVANDKVNSGSMSIYLYKPEVTIYSGMSNSSYFWSSSSATGAETPATVTFDANSMSGASYAGASPAPTFAASSDSSSSSSSGSSSSGSGSGTSYVVSGAGTAINGTYTEAGTYGGKSYYTYTPPAMPVTYYLFYYDSQKGWMLGDSLPNTSFTPPALPNVFYMQSPAADAPDGSTWYTTSAGTDPAPTVTEATNAAAQ